MIPLPRILLLFLFTLTSLASAAPNATPAPYILHLPGIGGPLSIDRAMAYGLHISGLPLPEIYDWTCHDPGLHALTAYARNMRQAEIVAGKLVAFRQSHSTTPILITAHSGGTAVAVWALEKLPSDIQVDTIVLLASALSPGYDLSTALSHVRGHCYVFYSPYDLILSAGTRAFGTMDRVNSVSAGFTGFIPPPAADLNQYKKIISMPYDPAWSRYGNIGDHIGPMRRAFSAYILSPLLGGTPPPDGALAATHPTSRASF